MDWGVIAKQKSMIKKDKAIGREWRIRSATLALLGGKCVQCGFSDVRALQIDHINGGGNKDRRSSGGPSTYYGIVQKSFSNGDGKYQLLCANCNMIKRFVNKEHN